MLRCRNAALALVALLVGVLVVVGHPIPAQACSCVQATLEEHASYADAVFDGTATRETIATTTTMQPNQPVMGGGSVTYEFAVARTLKGSVPNPAAVFTNTDGASCGTSFTVGVEYRVFVKRNERGDLTTSLCSGNVRTSDLPPEATTTTTRRPPATTAAPTTTTTTVVEPATSSTTTTTDENAVVINDADTDGGGNGWLLPVAGGAAVAALAGGAYYLRVRSRRTDPLL